MQSRQDIHQTCSRCRSRPATVQYTDEGQSVMVCPMCLDRLEVQGALETEFQHVLELEKLGKSDEALACLDAFLVANLHRDHDGWVARSIADDRIFVLWLAGRYEEAEKACPARDQLGFPDVGERWQHAHQRALILDELGRYREAVAVLEDALIYRDPKDLPAARGLLATLAELSEKLGQPVDPKWRRLVEKVARRFRADVPSRDTLAESILALRETTREMKPKFPHEWKEDEADDEAL